MSLLAKLTVSDGARSGRVKHIGAYAGSLVGLQEPEPGWILCNGVVVPSSGNSPVSGIPYATLNALLGTRFGAAGTLPVIANGRMMIGRGTNGARVFALGGALDLSAITLSVAQMPQHRHYFTITDPFDTTFMDIGATPIGSTGFGSEPFTSGVNNGHGTATSGAAGGGGSHNNMAPYVVVGAALVRL